MPYSAQQHGSVALSRSQELSSTSYRIETGLKAWRDDGMMLDGQT